MMPAIAYGRIKTTILGEMLIHKILLGLTPSVNEGIMWLSQDIV